MFLVAPALSLTYSERILLRDLAWQTVVDFGSGCAIINIGVALGGSCVCLRAGAPKAHLIGIDVDADSLRGDWTFIHGDSRRVYKQFVSPIHLLFVDGDHDYYGVRDDILNWCTLLPVGGRVAFHDYGNGEKAPHTAGVKRAVDELLINAGGWETISSADSILAFRKTEGLNHG